MATLLDLHANTGCVPSDVRPIVFAKEIVN